MNTRINRWLDQHEVIKLFLVLALACTNVIVDPSDALSVLAWAAVMSAVLASRFAYIRK